MKAVVLPDCPAPYFALGHSMASMVLFRAATKRGCWFTRVVMTAPMVKIAGLPLPQLLCGQIADGLTMFGFGKNAVPGDKAKYRQDQPFEGNTLTSDRERFLRNFSVLQAAPELAIGAPTIGWLKAALDAIERVGNEKFAPRIRVPVLMLAASDDQIVVPKAVEDLAIRLRAGSQIVLRGSRHEILQERDSIREQFWAAFDAFVPGVAMSKASSPDSILTAASWMRRSPAARMRPPSRGSPPSHEVTMPPDRSTIGISGKMSNGCKPASTTRSICPSASRQ
jgi:lysophospholipase